MIQQPGKNRVALRCGCIQESENGRCGGRVQVPREAQEGLSRNTCVHSPWQPHGHQQTPELACGTVFVAAPWFPVKRRLPPSGTAAPCSGARTRVQARASTCVCTVYCLLLAGQHVSTCAGHGKGRLLSGQRGWGPTHNQHSLPAQRGYSNHSGGTAVGAGCRPHPDQPGGQVDRGTALSPGVGAPGQSLFVPGGRHAG